MNEYNTISGNFWKAFGKGAEMTLATAAGEDVTARTVSVVQMDGKIYFSTFDRSVKYGQIQQNRNVAICAGDIFLKGTARIIGGIDAPESKAVKTALVAAFPDAVGMLGLPGVVAIEVSPVSGGFGRGDTGGMFVIDFSTRQAHAVQFGQ